MEGNEMKIALRKREKMEKTIVSFSFPKYSFPLPGFATFVLFVVRF